RRARPRSDRGIESALDERNPDQVVGQTLFLKRATHRRVIASAFAYPRLDEVFSADVTAVVVEVTHDACVPAHRKLRQRERLEPGEVARRFSGKGLDRKRARRKPGGADHGPRRIEREVRGEISPPRRTGRGRRWTKKLV